jgi:hypothetical protein
LEKRPAEAPSVFEREKEMRSGNVKLAIQGLVRLGFQDVDAAT